MATPTFILPSAPTYTEGFVNGLNVYPDPTNFVANQVPFTRATTATRTNAAGLVELVPYNLVQYSEMFSQGAWTKTRSLVLPNTILAPNDTLTADSLIENTATATHSMSSAFTAISSSYTVSIYAKANQRSWLNISWLSTANASAYFNLSNGTLGTVGSAATATITSVGNGWYRCTMTATLVAGANTLAYYLASADNTLTYTGDGVSGIYLWGAQSVEGTAALPYQLTETRLNRPRVDFSLGGCPSLLLEPQRTNLALRSEEFDNATWSKAGVTITPNQAISPSGTNTMDLITFPSSGLSVLQSIAVTSGATYTFSIWLYTQSGTQTIEIGNINVGVFQTITITTTPTRYEITQVASSATRFPGIRSTGAYSIFAWGAQLEAGAYATSYIPTTSASVTRNADVISRGNIFTNGLITASGGTWFVDLRGNVSVTRDASSGGIFLNTGLNSQFGEGFTLRNIVSGRFSISKLVASSNTVIYTLTTDTSKIAIKWNGTTADVFVNGVKVVAATPFTPTAMQNLIGEGQNRAIQFNSMALFPTPLTDGEMSMLTSGIYTPALAYAQLGLTSESPACLTSSVNALL
jgi:hypothetical protein